MAKQSTHIVTLADAQAQVKKSTYTMLPSGRSMVCELTLSNGFTIVGSTTVLDINNFKLQASKNAALDNALNNAVYALSAIKQQVKFQADLAGPAGNAMTKFTGKPKVAVKKAASPVKATVTPRLPRTPKKVAVKAATKPAVKRGRPAKKVPVATNTPFNPAADNSL